MEFEIKINAKKAKEQTEQLTKSTEALSKSLKGVNKELNAVNRTLDVVGSGTSSPWKNLLMEFLSSKIPGGNIAKRLLQLLPSSDLKNATVTSGFRGGVARTGSGLGKKVSDAAMGGAIGVFIQQMYDGMTDALSGGKVEKEARRGRYDKDVKDIMSSTFNLGAYLEEMRTAAWNTSLTTLREDLPQYKQDLENFGKELNSYYREGATYAIPPHKMFDPREPSTRNRVVEFAKGNAWYADGNWNYAELEKMAWAAIGNQHISSETLHAKDPGDLLRAATGKFHLEKKIALYEERLAELTQQALPILERAAPALEPLVADMLSGLKSLKEGGTIKLAPEESAIPWQELAASLSVQQSAIQIPKALSADAPTQSAQSAAALKERFNEAQMALLDFERQYQSIFNKSGMLHDSIAAEMDRVRQAADVAREEEAISAEQHADIMIRIKQVQHEKELQVARDAASGAERAFKNYADSATDMAHNMEVTVSGAFNTIGQAFQLTTDGMKFNWRSAMDSIMNQSFQMMAVNPILGGIADGIGELFSPSAGSGVNPLASSMKGAIGRLKNAHGNAFSAGTGLSAYRNSIVDTPTYFAYAHGGIPGSRIGLMGEKAGSPGEVIAPLFRASNGDLGVKSVGGGTSEVHVHVDVHNNSNEQVSVRESRGSNGMPRLDVLIGEIDHSLANRVMSGQSALASAMDRTRGTSSAMSLYWK